MWLSRVLNAFKSEPIVKKHTNEFTGIVKETLDSKWSRRKVKMMTQHYYGRNRNCYRLAVVKMQWNLKRVTKSRSAARKDFQELCDLRIEGGGKELHYNPLNMRETLARLNIGLNRKVLANLAIWEPRSFRSIVGLCAHKESMPEEEGGMDKPPAGPGIKVITKGQL